MNNSAGSVLVLALGNDILGDDAVGLVAARQLQAEFTPQCRFMEASGAGLDLLDSLEGCDQVLLLDSMCTDQYRPGTVLELAAEDYHHALSRSPHYAGLPQALRLAAQLGLAMPGDLRMLVMVVENPFDFKDGLSPAVAEALPDFVARAGLILRGWQAAA